MFRPDRRIGGSVIALTASNRQYTAVLPSKIPKCLHFFLFCETNVCYHENNNICPPETDNTQGKELSMGIILLIINAIVTIAVADSKGYRPGLCFFLSLIFGFVPLIVLIFLPNKKDAESERYAADCLAKQQAKEIAELKSRLRRLEEEQRNANQ